jgi:hypothetical protein
MANAINNTLQGFKHVIVPETQDLIAVLVQCPGSSIIIWNRITVLTAIKFNNKLWIMAGKVRNETSKWNLPPEVAPL